MVGGPSRKQPLEPQKEERAEEKAEQKEEQNFFKSEILQKIERGESIAKKQQPAEEQQAEHLEPKPQTAPKFIPRALWGK